MATKKEVLDFIQEKLTEYNITEPKAVKQFFDDLKNLICQKFSGSDESCAMGISIADNLCDLVLSSSLLKQCSQNYNADKVIQAVKNILIYTLQKFQPVSAEQLVNIYIATILAAHGKKIADLIEPELNKYNAATPQDINNFFTNLKELMKENFLESSLYYVAAIHLIDKLYKLACVMSTSSNDPQTVIINVKISCAALMQDLQKASDEYLLYMKKYSGSRSLDSNSSPRSTP